MSRVTVICLAFAAALTVSSISSAGPDPVPGLPAVSAQRAATGAQRAQERRRTFVFFVGFASVVLGLAGLWLLQRSRARKARPPVVEPVTIKPAEPSEAVPRPVVGAAMVCPTCRSEYTAEARFCKFDGNRLISLRAGTDPRGPTGGICPVCGQGYDPGVASCPVHQEELVPAALYQAHERSSGSFPKICPTCGVQYPNGSGFCGADGSALVTVN